MTIDDIKHLKPDRIVISPGPGKPEEAGISIALIKHFGEMIPILGICLGHQAITVAFGGVVGRADEIVHGKTSKIHHVGSKIFYDVPAKFEATRYHSLVSNEENFPMNDLKVTARTENGLIMALEHKKFPIYGLQFHPESILTNYGPQIIKNFLEI